MSDLKSVLWIAGGTLVLLALALLWQLLVNVGLLSGAFFPSPAKTWEALQRGIATGSLLSASLQTILHMVFGWLLASLVGIALGAMIGMSPAARVYLSPSLEFIRPVPASAIAPVAIVFLGLTEQMIVALIGFGALWPMLLTTVHGFTAVHPRLYEVRRMLGQSRWVFVWKIALPSASKDILDGLRLGLTIALILAVVGEMLTMQGGLGSHILLASRRFRAPDVFAGVVLLGFIGLFSNALLRLAERRLLRWKFN
jgi:sulfonate transport system permease protein